MISIIVATSKNSVIGKNGEIPWYMPIDLKHFASITRGNTVLMGRKTFESITKRLGHPLPDRKTVVLTNQKDFTAPECTVVHSWEEAIEATKNENVFVCGGENIYKLALPHTDKLILTLVDTVVDGDTFFHFNPNEWKVLSEEPHTKDEKNKFDCIFYEYEKRK